MLRGKFILGCSRFLEEYSQDLAKVETFSDLDEVLLGKGYLPSGRFENNTYGVSPVNAFFQATHHMADELAFNERSNIGDLAGIQPRCSVGTRGNKASVYHTRVIRVLRKAETGSRRIPVSYLQHGTGFRQ